jgi:hypothetical protein
VSRILFFFFGRKIVHDPEQLRLPASDWIHDSELFNSFQNALDGPFHCAFDELLEPNCPAAWIVADFGENFGDFHNVEPENLAAVVVNFIDLAVQVEQGFVEDFELLIGQFIMKLFVLNPNVQR